MPRLKGVDIPNNKKVKYSLTHIKGIGLTTAEKIVEGLSIDPEKKARDLTEDEVSKITALIDETYLVEGELTRQVRDHIKRLKDVGTYRGLRHSRSLPVRGQKTRRNARTRKGPRRSVSGVSVRKAISKT